MVFGMEHQLSHLMRENGARSFASEQRVGQRHDDVFDSFSLFFFFCNLGVILIRIYSFEQGEYTGCSDNSIWHHDGITLMETLPCNMFRNECGFVSCKLAYMWFSCVFVADTFQTTHVCAS